MVITIDGLGVNGKSTLASKIAQKLDFKNFNTGAIYRSLALFIINNNLDIKNVNKILNEIENIKIDFIEDKVLLNNEDVTNEIRTEKISFYSTEWATIPGIKDFVRNYQKEFIKNNNTVMEGRDIATRIAPDADIKFYLYSDFDTRVKRLWNQDKTVPLEKVRECLLVRDEIDLTRGNFIKPDNAIEIDVTNYSIEEVYELMMKEIQKIVL